MSNSFPATLASNRSAETVVVEVIPAPHGVAVVLPGGEQQWWAFESVRASRRGAALQLQWPATPSADQTFAILTLDDPRSVAAIAAVNSRIARGENPSTSSDFLMHIGMAIFATVLIIGAAIWQGLPWITARLASLLPVSVEEKIGRASLETMAPRPNRCQDDAVSRIVDRLERTLPETPYRFRAYVVEDEMVNAFAAPGGYVVVFRGLLRKTRRPEQLAAVLAHEMQHVVQRHGTQGMVRSLSIWLAFALFTGDPTGAITVMASNLGSLAYQRADELSADREGLRMLADAGVDPMAMVSMLELLNEETPELPRAARYFSSHPLTEDRIAEVRNLAEPMRYSRKTLLSGIEWPPPKSNCRMERLRTE
ncbi:MAG: M48 family metallopeptidase [Bryobacterales bacterium]|nr:M48 family metallopeptidase [Bryobacterales bacterium]